VRRRTRGGTLFDRDQSDSPTFALNERATWPYVEAITTLLRHSLPKSIGQTPASNCRQGQRGQRNSEPARATDRRGVEIGRKVELLKGDHCRIAGILCQARSVWAVAIPRSRLLACENGSFFMFFLAAFHPLDEEQDRRRNDQPRTAQGARSHPPHMMEKWSGTRSSKSNEFRSTPVLSPRSARPVAVR
jgi:hypothetical protein